MSYELHLIKTYDEDYKAIDCKHIHPWMLYLFLTSDVRNGYQYSLEIAYDNNMHAETGNTTYVVKENGYIYLIDAISESEEDQDSVEVKMPIKEYINLITTWGTKIFTEDPSKRPSEVRIHYENEKFYFDIKQ